MKRAQAVLKGKPAALVIIIVMLFGIIFYFTILPPPYTEGLLLEIPATEYENTVLDANPGKLTSGWEGVSLEKVDLPLVIVDNTPQTEDQLLGEQISIRKSFFKARYSDYDFSVDTNTFSAARLHFTVAEKTGDGILTVRLNQHTVFSREVGVGETLDISLPKYHLHEGDNTFRISVMGPGVKIWQTNSYLLTNVKLGIDDYLGKSAQQTFTISKNTARDIENAEFTALVKQSGEAVNLGMELNGEQIFNAIPPQSFSLNIPLDLFEDGSNTLSWSADRNGKYSVRYGKVILKEVEVEQGGKRYYFSVSEKDMHFASVPSKYNCELYLQKESGDNKITIALNSRTDSYTFDNGEIREDVCEYLKGGTNKIVLSVEDAVTLSKLMLTIKNE